MRDELTIKGKNIGKFKVHSLQEFDELRDILKRKLN